MTVSYNSDVSSVSSTNFFRLLLRWKGSIWKSVYKELMIWLTGYLFVALVYHFILIPNKIAGSFNQVAYYCGKELHNYIPLTFMLGFFVSIIVERWRTTFSNMGWIESTALTVNATILGQNEETRLIRRNIIRYLILAQILTFRDISIRVRRRFPNIDSIMKAGFLTKDEEQRLDDIDLAYNKYWVPINWAIVLANRANTNGYVSSAPGMVSLITEIKNFRNSLATICNFDWVPIPIAYPQVVFFAVRFYFLFCIVTRQYIRMKENEFEMVHLFIRPFITMIEFICIVGWLKVAEALLNPLGEDDDDFECNFLIDKNIFTGIKIVDEFDNGPEMFEDRFSDPDAAPIYSADSQKYQTTGALVGSVSNITLAHIHDDIPMVTVDPRHSFGDISLDPSTMTRGIRRRFKSGGSCSNPGSFKHPRMQRQFSDGEKNDGFEVDKTKESENEPATPTKHGKFFTNLSKVDENDETGLETNVVSRV